MALNQKQLFGAVLEQRAMAQRLFSELRRRTADISGVTRAAYGPGEETAHKLMAETANSLGLEVTTDNARNLYMTLPGVDRTAPAVIVGSHLDSVPKGGNYDGAAGVVAGILALTALRQTRRFPHCDVTVMAIRAEESAWFSREHVGSRAALGMLTEDELDLARRADTGLTLGEHMQEAGCDVASLRAGAHHLNPDRVRNYFELHIEQGPVLVDRRLPIGIVTAIRGNVRAREARCVGEYAHAGAVPRHLRHDAVLAVAELIHGLEASWKKIEDRGGDLVLTVGTLTTNPDEHAVSKVPGDVRFTLEFRSHDPATLDDVTNIIKHEAAAVGARRGLIIDPGPFVRVEPTLMDPALRTLLATGCNYLALEAMELASGGGHDAAEFACAGIASAMIFIRNPCGSHNPSEHMELDDFIQGTQLLAWALTEVGTV